MQEKPSASARLFVYRHDGAEPLSKEGGSFHTKNRTRLRTGEEGRMNKTRREIRTCAHEVRADPQGNGLRFTGYAALFDSWSQDLGGFREQIAPGAFARAILEDDVRALFNHDPSYVLGRSRAGTLRLFEDATGLGFEIDAPDTAWARDLHALVARGDVDQCSFGFEIVSEETDFRDDGSIHWRITEVNLHEVSVCTFPAYEATSVQAREAQRDAIKAQRLEDIKTKMREELRAHGA